MKINLPKLARILLIGAAITFFVKAPVFAASSVSISPATQTVQNGNSFTVTVGINTDGGQIMAGDAVLRYQAADLDFVSSANGGFFTDYTYANDATNGQIELHGFYRSANTYNTSSTGNLATITFKTKKGSGSSQIAFVCTGSGADTQLISSTGTNILSCSPAPGSTTVTYTGAVTPSPTTPASTANPSASPTLPTAPTVTPSQTPTPTTSSSGNRRPSCTGLSVLPGGTLTTAMGITFTCAGNDPDGYINAAEFLFGDSSSSTTITGATNGKVMTKHTYASAGTYQVACAVIDNSGDKSDRPLICSYTVTVQKSSAAPAVGGSYVRPATVPLADAAAPTVTPPMATFAPYATPTPFDTNSLTQKTDQTQEAAKTTTPWLIVIIIALVGILVIVGIILLIRALLRHHDPPIPPIMEQQQQETPPPIMY